MVQNESYLFGNHLICKAILRINWNEVNGFIMFIEEGQKRTFTTCQKVLTFELGALQYFLVTKFYFSQLYSTLQL